MAPDHRRILPACPRLHRVYPRARRYVRLEQHTRGDYITHYGLDSHGQRTIITPVLWAFNEFNQGKP